MTLPSHPHKAVAVPCCCSDRSLAHCAAHQVQYEYNGSKGGEGYIVDRAVELGGVHIFSEIKLLLAFYAFGLQLQV